MRRQGCLEQMVRGMTQVLSRPLTLKMRTAVYHDTKVAHNLVQRAKLWDVSMVTVSSGSVGVGVPGGGVEWCQFRMCGSVVWKHFLG